jgi:glycosyltransferase involved in cell wall biosynthesis
LKVYYQKKLKMIKIGVDGRLLQGNLTGVGKYMLNLIDQLCIINNNISFSIYSNKEILCKFKSDRVKVIYDSTWSAKIKPMVWSKLFLYRLINRDKPNIYLSGDGFVPLLINKVKIVSVVHDVNSIIAPETMSRLRMLTDKLFFKTDIKKADVVISNSEGTADKLKQYYGISTDVVINPIIDDWYKKLDEGDVKRHLPAMGLAFPYILTVATREPRKNLDKTINAFLSIKKSGFLPSHKLVLVGSKGWKSDTIDELTSKNEDIIVQLGYTADEMMPYLYNGADVFVFPSIYEGFGMPVREALLCDVPVITSDLPELREASYGKAIYINPQNDEEFKRAIVKAVSTKHNNLLGSAINPASKQLNQLLSILNIANGI